jgi:hypothetical protein
MSRYKPMTFKPLSADNRLEALRNCDLIAGIGATEAEPPQQPPASVAPPTSKLEQPPERSPETGAQTGVGRTTRKADTGDGFHPATVPTTSYYEAALRACGPIVIAPDGHWLEGFASLEHAQSHAYDLNEWHRSRPDPALVQPFFAPLLERDTSVERLMRILGPWRFEQTP